MGTAVGTQKKGKAIFSDYSETPLTLQAKYEQAGIASEYSAVSSYLRDRGNLTDLEIEGDEQEIPLEVSVAVTEDMAAGELSLFTTGLVSGWTAGTAGGYKLRCEYVIGLKTLTIDYGNVKWRGYKFADDNPLLMTAKFAARGRPSVTLVTTP